MRSPTTLLADETVREHLKVDANGTCTIADSVNCIHVRQHLPDETVLRGPLQLTHLGRYC